MYGKKRITLTKTNQIVLAGKDKGSTGGSWIPIGVYGGNDKTITARFLTPDNMWERKLSDEVSQFMTFKTKKELRTFIGNLYEIN